MVVQSEDAGSVNTHWVGRRLWCAEEDCPGCAHAPIRTVCYFVATVEMPGSCRPVLVETTPSELCRLSGFLQMANLKFGPGLRLLASKRYAKSPTRFEPIDGSGVVVESLTPMGKAWSAAAVLAGLPLPLDDETEVEFCTRIHQAVRLQLEGVLAKQN